MTSTLALIFEISPQGFGLYTILVNEYFNVSGATHCPRRRDVRSLFCIRIYSYEEEYDELQNGTLAEVK